MPQKELLVVGGPNGSGKSTFVTRLLRERDRPYLCADLIAKEFSQLGALSQQVEAGREFLRRSETQLLRDEDFIIESTLSGRTLRRFLERARDAAYNITIVFIYLDSPITCIDRVRQRVRRGGHHVPDEDVHRRFARSCDNFWHIYCKIADQWVVYYNAGSKFVEVVFGSPDGFAVCDDDLFHRFLEFAGDMNHG